MNTVFFLMAEFAGQAEIPLEQLCPKYTGLDIARAKRAAARQQLPFPVHRTTNSQKAPWVVHIEDLARHIDARAKQGRAEHQAINVA